MSFRNKTCVACSGTYSAHVCWNVWRSRFNLLPLGKFISTWGWMTNKISLLLVVWVCDGCCERARRRGWSFLSTEGEKTHATLHFLLEWAHFSTPYSSHWWERHFRPRIPHQAHISCIRNLLGQNLKKRKQMNSGQVVVCSLVCLNDKVDTIVTIKKWKH